MKATFVLLSLLPLSVLAQSGSSRPETAPANASGNGSSTTSEEVTKLDPYQVTDARPAPFSNASVDLPRTPDDVQPYVVFDASDLARSGALDVQDFLRKGLTMDATRMTGAQGISLAGVGSSFDLRGLGSNHTLVLINGRRTSDGNNAAANVVGGQTNLNGIPLAAIERIEVLPTSGSAIYGASAAGGVINVVLKRDYTGGELRTSYQNTFDSDAPVRQVNLSYGLALERGRTQVTLAGGYSDQAILAYQDRPFLHEYELYRQQLEGGPAGYSPSPPPHPTSAVRRPPPCSRSNRLSAAARSAAARPLCRPARHPPRRPPP